MCFVDHQQVEEAQVGHRGVQHLVEEPLYPRRSQPRQADDDPRKHAERIGLKSMTAPEFLESGGIEDGEAKPEPVSHLVSPLECERRWADDKHSASAVT